MLPGPYERWFTELTGRAGPVETRSTCDDCAMAPGAPDLPPSGPFDPAVRCCTYHPHLAPYLVGGILERGTDEGRARVRARIAARVAVTPLGLGAPPSYDRAHAAIAAGPGGFGHSREILCPFHEDARCTIWADRGIACAAFHCKLDRGALGQSLWSLLVVGFHAVERVLARWLVERQGLEVEACDALLHGPEDAALDARAWGAWRGREEDYFIAASRLVEGLSFGEVLALGGANLDGLTEALRRAIANLDAIPERVQRNDEILYHLGRPGTVRLQHRGVPLDLLEVPTSVADELRRIGEAEPGALGFDAALLRKLLDWQVLVKP